MLKTRIITALVALAILLMALFAFPRWAWALFTLLIVAASIWEWSRFCGSGNRASRVYFALSALLAAFIGWAYLNGDSSGVTFRTIAAVGFVLATIFWCLLATAWLAKTWRPESLWVKAVVGWLVIFPTWLAFLLLRDIGPWALLSFAAIVWVADIAAYFAGRRFGRHKLAPAISPGKTIEGVYGAVAGVTLYYFAWQYLIANTSVRSEDWVWQVQSHGWELLAVFLVLTIMSVVGDLFESWMKRGAGMKDSSNLLPGHGGVLDRIDALTSTLPLAALYMTLTGNVQ